MKNAFFCHYDAHKSSSMDHKLRSPFFSFSIVVVIVAEICDGRKLQPRLYNFFLFLNCNAANNIRWTRIKYLKHSSLFCVTKNAFFCHYYVHKSSLMDHKLRSPFFFLRCCCYSSRDLRWQKTAAKVIKTFFFSPMTMLQNNIRWTRIKYLKCFGLFCVTKNAFFVTMMLTRVLWWIINWGRPFFFPRCCCYSSRDLRWQKTAAKVIKTFFFSPMTMLQNNIRWTRIKYLKRSSLFCVTENAFFCHNYAQKSSSMDHKSRSPFFLPPLLLLK